MSNKRMNNKNNKREGGSMLDTAAGMVMPQGFSAGLAALGLVGLNEYKKKSCGRKMRGGDANNGMMTNVEKNEVTDMVDELMKTERNQRNVIIEKVKSICAKLPKEEAPMEMIEEELNMTLPNNSNTKKNNANANKKNNANANANVVENMSEEMNEEMMGGKRNRKNRKQRGGELAGASLDVAFGGNAGIDGLMAHAGVHGMTGAKANLMNLMGSLDASGQTNAKLGLEGGKRKNRKQRGGSDMTVSCPDGATPIVSLGAKADIAGSAQAGVGLGGVSAGVSGEADASGMAQAGPAVVSGSGSLDAGMEAGLAPTDGQLTGSLSGQAGAEAGAEAGMTGGKRNRKNGGGVIDSSMELIFPAGLTAGAATFGLLLADEASKRSYVKKAVSSVRKTTKAAAAKAKKMVSRK